MPREVAVTLPDGYGVAAVDDPTPCEREADDEAPLDASPLAEARPFEGEP